MAEGTFPKTDGDILYASEVNSFKRCVAETYVSTGFDSSASGAQTDEQSYEFSDITASDLVGKRYLRIVVRGEAESDYESTAGYAGTVSLKAQAKYLGDTYADIFAYEEKLYIYGSTSDTTITDTSNFEILYTLTANDLANGCKIKLFSKSVTGGTGATAHFTNKQSWIELLN